MTRPVVVFPHPLSPTSPSVSPLRMKKLTPSTALTTPTTLEEKKPLVMGKCFFRSFTSKRTGALSVV